MQSNKKRSINDCDKKGLFTYKTAMVSSVYTPLTDYDIPEKTLQV